MGLDKVDITQIYERNLPVPPVNTVQDAIELIVIDLINSHDDVVGFVNRIHNTPFNTAFFSARSFSSSGRQSG